MRIALHAPPRGTPISVDSLAEHIFKTEADLFVAPEYFVQDRASEQPYAGCIELAPIPKARRDDFVGSLCEKTREADTLIIPGSVMYHEYRRPCLNSAPVIYKGQTISERFKRNEANSDKVMARLVKKKMFGKKSDDGFEHRGVTYRLDICLDTIEQGDHKEYDIHIAICSRMPRDLFRESRPRARINGLFILVDNQEREPRRRLGVAMTRQLPERKRHYHMPIVAQSYEHTDVFEVELKP